MSEEWISACDAYGKVYPGQKITGGPNSVIRRAAAGAIKARASLLVKSGLRGDEERDSELPKEFWGGSSMIPDWKHGDFSSKFQLSGRGEDWQAIGVTFNRSDIDSMVRSASHSADVSQRLAEIQKSAPIRKKKHDWEGALIHVIHTRHRSS